MIRVLAALIVFMVSSFTCTVAQVLVQLGETTYTAPDTVGRSNQTVMNGSKVSEAKKTFEIDLPTKFTYQVTLKNLSTQNVFTLKRKKNRKIPAGEYQLTVIASGELYPADTLTTPLAIAKNTERVDINFFPYIRLTSERYADSVVNYKQQRFHISVNKFLPWNDNISVSWTNTSHIDSLTFMLTNNSDDCINGFYDAGQIDISIDGDDTYQNNYHFRKNARMPWYSSPLRCIEKGKSIALRKQTGHGTVKDHFFATAFYLVTGEISPQDYSETFSHVTEQRKLDFNEKFFNSSSNGTTAPTHKSMNGVAWHYNVLSIHSKTFKIKKQ